MERELDVFIAAHMGVPQQPVGRLWTRTRGVRESASFEYADSWVREPHGFALDRELPLGGGTFHTERALFGAFTDPAPDRWGQTLLRRIERARARAEGRTPRTLLAVDFLAAVDDETRLGALRFRDVGSETFLTVGARVPPLVELPRLLRATRAVLADRETADDLALLLAPGTSLGGARPKASVREADGTLAIAKFPARDEEWPVTRWEASTLAMAEAAGIVVPAHRLVLVSRRPVLVLRRFDRRGDARIPYVSAMTAIGAHDGDDQPWSYLHVAEALRIDGARVAIDLPQLWRRIVFNVLVSNTDDHARNHGFLRDDGGWTLSPAFDLNPMPVDVRPRVHALAIDETDATSSLELAASVASSFGLRSAQARQIIGEVGRVVRRWREFARTCGITNAQADRMESAFEHADLEAATRA